MITVNQRRLRHEMCTNRRAHGRQCDPGNVLTKQPINLARVLIRNEAKVELCCCARWDNGFNARSLVAATNPIDSKCGPDSGSLVQRVSSFAPTALNTSILKDLGIRRTNARHVSALPIAPLPHMVVEAGDCHTPIGVMQLSDDFTKCLKWIMNRSTKVA